jgi:hypothetical protein
MGADLERIPGRQRNRYTIPLSADRVMHATPTAQGTGPDHATAGATECILRIKPDRRVGASPYMGRERRQRL